MEKKQSFRFSLRTCVGLGVCARCAFVRSFALAYYGLFLSATVGLEFHWEVCSFVHPHDDWALTLWSFSSQILLVDFLPCFRSIPAGQIHAYEIGMCPRPSPLNWYFSSSSSGKKLSGIFFLCRVLLMVISSGCWLICSCHVSHKSLLLFFHFEMKGNLLASPQANLSGDGVQFISGGCGSVVWN